ncbi:hypothetical protein EA658_16670 [Pseudoxanthomonas winnipegensis]|uniref:Uncharacterized protein n=1 Tax=Pseudoxanthomonas winnipegensis TaxID=2480810 RepID=A0ABY1WCG9_9GAMM|nr:hypothetical protein [Pseudoxanthomonas winnipegensis]TAA11295.1 hypothetical protein EA659_08085 [Pseudoxanthomonas winnipegensis]TAA18718.1 hypothetical protein EA658_16670 [Pseudoxanthomonas winnipegensis]TAH73905.1 hypothetical protein EA657_00075 [Pseudoxanthomonas winnipegensis]
MEITNSHTGPLGLPDGTILAPGIPTKLENWDELKKNAVVQAWLEAKVLNESKDGTYAPALIGTDIFPSEIEISEGKTVALGDVVAQSHADSGLSLEDWNSLPIAERDAKIGATVDQLKADAAAEAAQKAKAAEQADQDRAALYAKLDALGVTYDKRTGTAKLQAALEEAEKAKAAKNEG